MVQESRFDGADPSAPVIAPTMTKLPDCRGLVVVTGSHGGAYCGQLAVAAGVRAAIFHDAGIGLDEAGVEALAILDRLGIAAAAVSHLTSRIGDTDDMMARGVLSRANGAATKVDVIPGQTCAEAAVLLARAPWHRAQLEKSKEARRVWQPDGARRPITIIDSAALVDAAADRGAVIVTGSHGGLVGGDPAMALRAEGVAAAFNDAGIGIDRAGLGRLAALDARGIAAIAIAAASARIGDGQSTLDGVISAVNETARARGACEGQRARDIVLAWAMAD